MTDHFSGFTWGTTCEDKAADRLTRFVYDILVLGGFGCPKIILSDNGKEVFNRTIASKKVK